MHRPSMLSSQGFTENKAGDQAEYGNGGQRHCQYPQSKDHIGKGSIPTQGREGLGKICGISDPETLNFIINHSNSPKFVGFICNYPKSSRYIKINDLKNLLNVKKSIILETFVAPFSSMLW